MRRFASPLNPIIFILLALCVLSPLAVGRAAPAYQGPTPEERAQALLEGLTPEERVGQLFMLTFTGVEAGEESLIYDLIANYHIGGLIFLGENGNFSDSANTPEGIATLTRTLQEIESLTSQGSMTDPVSGEIFSPAFIPLFISISQEGDGAPYDQFTAGLTPLPSGMALGATWHPDYARQVGYVLGEELSTLGFNLLLGPSLDVLETPPAAGGLGIRVFGGDPYWVGQMGSAYVTGVHEGSLNRITVIAKHFPGFGGTDRLPGEEIPTIRKSVEQLGLIDLPPFYAVTGEAETPDATVDGLLLSHIRVQGLLGSIRASAQPISFDAEALEILMGLPALASWRADGGLMVSDDLGSRAVRLLRDPNEISFPIDLVARDAFITGSDLLYLGGFVDEENPENYPDLIHALDQFAEKYRIDSVFAEDVDASVLRILTRKFRMYETFTLTSVLPDPNALYVLGQGEQITQDVARQSATLIWPSESELDTVIPTPPSLSDKVVFLTDTHPTTSCAECPEEPTLEADALEKAVVALYGQPGGRIVRQNLTSYSFEDLEAMLDSDGGFSQLQTDLRNAQWIVFSLLDVDPTRPTSQALHRFLTERPDLQGQKRIIVFAFNAPYYLDATSIAKLSAYYALYSKSPPFLDVAANLLFDEIQPIVGASPVSILGINYDLTYMTSPDPVQIIPLHFNIEAPEVEPDAVPLPVEINLGDTAPVRTGVIKDHNGNSVPDGTPVRFFLAEVEPETNTVALVLLEKTATTVEGVAHISFQIDTPGNMVIYALCGQPEAFSEELNFITNPLEVDPTQTPANVETEAPPATALPTQETPFPTSTPQLPPPETGTEFADWLIALLVSGVMAATAYQLSSLAGRVRWGIRWGLVALISGMSSYTYLAAGLPGSDLALNNWGTLGVALSTLAGAAGGMALAYTVRIIRRVRRKRKK